jgi:diguanylate cyclase (GGDEF)-like protein
MVTVERLDTLTGLVRRSDFPALERMSPDAVVLLLNIDAFRAVNQQHGHEVGDVLLAEIGRRLGEAAAPWPIYRIGGDEFAVLAHLPDEDAIRRLGAAVRGSVEEPFRGLAITVTMAAARWYPATGEDMLRLADQGLWTQRSVQRGQLVPFPR